MRSLKLIFGLGVTFLIISCLPSGSATSGKLISYGEYRGHFVAVTEGLHIQAWGVDNRNLTLYILDFDNGYRAINESSLENVSYLCSFENLSYIDTNIIIPKPGWYTILVTSSNAEYTVIRYDINISRNIPHIGPLILGLSLISCCIFFKLYKMVSERRVIGDVSHVSKNGQT